jgi:hypothetical protein
VGSFRVCRLSDSSIVKLYRDDGVSRFDICLKARIYDRELTEILKRNGVPARTDAEWRALGEAKRTAYRERRKLRAAC